MDMDPDDYALKEIKQKMPEFVVCRHRFCPEPPGVYSVHAWGRSKGEGMKYNHYTWEALPDGTEFFGMVHIETGADFYVDAKRVREKYELFFSASQAAGVAEDTAYWYERQQKEREDDW